MINPDTLPKSVVSILLPIPPTLNKQIDLARDHWSKSAKEKKRWTNIIAYECRHLAAIASPVWIAFEWQVENWRTDSDNLKASAKYIFDGLVQAKVLPDDSLKIIQSPSVDFYEKSPNNKVLVMIASDFADFKSVLYNQLNSGREK